MAKLIEITCQGVAHSDGKKIKKKQFWLPVPMTKSNDYSDFGRVLAMTGSWDASHQTN